MLATTNFTDKDKPTEEDDLADEQVTLADDMDASDGFNEVALPAKAK